MISPTCGSIRIPIISTMKSLRPREPVLGERDRGEEREHDREHDGDADDDQAVLDAVPEVRSRDRVAEVVERRVQREPRRLEAVDLVVGLERRRDHPEDGEDEDDEDGEPDTFQPAPDPPPPALAPRGRRTAPSRRAAVDVALGRAHLRPPCAPSCARRRRSATATISSISIEIAAPRPKSDLRVALDEDVDAHQVVRRVDVRRADQQDTAARRRRSPR